ncbi:MAG: hypothetical protein Q9190_008090 [Brigantiaea leucoxantha]
MKLIIAGSTGFLATELIRQSLSIPAITSVIALARRPVSPPSDLPSGADAKKLHSVVVDNYDKWPESVTENFKDADGCIWSLPFEEVKRVCQDYTVAGLEAMVSARSSSQQQPFRFLYMSGSATERDQSKRPKIMAEYCLMRGEAENQVLSFASGHRGKLEAYVAKPGLIAAPGQGIFATMKAMALSVMGIVPSVEVAEVSAAVLDAVVKGLEEGKETLENEDLVMRGRKILKS